MKKIILIMVMLAGIGCMVTACGSKEEEITVNPISEQIPDTEVSNEEEPNSVSQTEEEINTDTNQAANTKTDEAGEGGKEADKEGEVNKAADKKTENEAENKTSDIFGDVFGDVDSLTEDGFVINCTIADDTTMVVNLEDKDLVKVHCTEATVYEIITIKNGGVNGPSDASMQAAAEEDVKAGSSVTLNGSYEGEEYYATRVGIVIED